MDKKWCLHFERDRHDLTLKPLQQTHTWNTHIYILLKPVRSVLSARPLAFKAATGFLLPSYHKQKANF